MAREVVCKFAVLNTANPRILNCNNEERFPEEEGICPYSMYCQNKVRAVNLNQARFCPNYEMFREEPVEES